MELLTIQEAMEKLKISRSAIYQAMEAGKLTRHEMYGKPLLDADEVARYRPNNYKDKRHRGPGRPRQTAGTE
jgi:excisionase family DNA binding protein